MLSQLLALHTPKKNKRKANRKAIFKINKKRTEQQENEEKGKQKIV